MLATLTPTPDAVSLAAFLGCLAFLTMLANGLIKLVKSFREQPPPAETYTTIKECKALHLGQDARISTVECEVKTLSRRLEESHAQLDKADEARASRIHTRIDTMDEKFEAKLQGIPDRMVALLRNAGVIK